jgi:hypothetical protein
MVMYHYQTVVLPAMASLLLLISLLLLMFPRVLASLLLLAFPAVGCLLCCCRVAVDVFLPLLCRPWSPCYAAFRTALEVSAATGVSNVSGGPCYCWRPCCCLRLSVVGLPPGIASLLVLPTCYRWLPCCCVYV